MTNAYDIGSSQYQFRNAYFGGTVNSNGSSTFNNNTVNGTATFNTNPNNSGETPIIIYWPNGESHQPWIALCNNSGAQQCLIGSDSQSSTVRFNISGTGNVFEITGGAVQVMAGNFQLASNVDLIFVGSSHNTTISSTSPAQASTFNIPDPGTTTTANISADQGNYNINGNWTFDNTVTASTITAPSNTSLTLEATGISGKNGIVLSENGTSFLESQIAENNYVWFPANQVFGSNSVSYATCNGSLNLNDGVLNMGKNTTSVSFGEPSVSTNGIIL